MKNLFFILSLTLAILSCSDNSINEPELTNEKFNAVEKFLPNDNGEIVKLCDGLSVMKIDSFFIYQDDILLSPEEVEFLSMPATTRATFTTNKKKYWTGGKVYYTFSSNFEKREDVLSAMEEISYWGGFRFIRRTWQKNYIEFDHHPNGGSSSYVGMIGGKQKLYIDTEAPWGTCVHEICHALGMYHEHTAQCRDNEIEILWDNIQPVARINYEIPSDGKDLAFFDEVRTRVVPDARVDFESIMMYSSINNHAINWGQPVMRRIGSAIPWVGQRNGLSLLDKICLTDLNPTYYNNQSHY